MLYLIRNSKKHILCVNTYQMVVLLMFNTREKLTYEEIKEVTIFYFGIISE